jgi:hypothetical protein
MTSNQYSNRQPRSRRGKFSQKPQSRPDISPLAPTERADAENGVETVEDGFRLSRLRRQAYLLYVSLDDPGSDLFEDFRRLEELESLEATFIDGAREM